MVNYEKIFEPYYEGGWEAYPLETTLITAGALNDYDAAIMHIEDYLDTQVDPNDNLAETYSDEETYEAGDYRIHNGVLYKCLEDIDEAEDFDPTKWEACLVTDEMATSGGTTVIANPVGTPTDDLETIQIGETIYDIPGGGGGNANIWTGTQAELEEVFDELEEGTQINITDDEQEVVEGGTIYSEEEQIIGLWTDNRPLYAIRKHYTVNKSANVTLDFTEGEAKVVDGYIINSLNGIKFPLNATWSSTTEKFLFDDTHFYVNTSSSIGDNSDLWLDVKYTKSTDAPLDAVVGKKTMYIASSDCYSTEEKEIGCWHNGKPVYQKCVDFGALPNATTKTVAHGIENLEDVVDARLFATDASHTNFLPLNFTATSSQNLPYQVSGYITSTNIRIDTGSNRSGFSGYVVIQYTKTTDTAGSGSYTPASGKAVHYSTDEQVIGTWIDGSTLYRRVIDLGAQLDVAYSSWTTTSISISNADKLIRCDGISNSNVFSSLIGYFDSNILKIQTPRNGNTQGVIYLILEYTKSV